MCHQDFGFVIRSFLPDTHGFSRSFLISEHHLEEIASQILSALPIVEKGHEQLVSDETHRLDS